MATTKKRKTTKKTVAATTAKTTEVTPKVERTAFMYKIPRKRKANVVIKYGDSIYNSRDELYQALCKMGFSSGCADIIVKRYDNRIVSEAEARLRVAAMGYSETTISAILAGKNKSKKS